MSDKKDQTFFERLFKLGQSSEGKNPSFTKFHWALVIASVGMGILIFSSFITMDEGVMPLNEPMDQQTVETSVLPKKDLKTMADYEKQYEDELTKMLNELTGVNDVSVMVNLDSSEEIVVAQNIRDANQKTEEKDQQGGTRQITDSQRDSTIVVAKKGNEDSPLIIKTIKPKVRGVFVIAKGAENPHVKTMITEAVQRLLDVPYHNISVQPKK